MTTLHQTLPCLSEATVEALHADYVDTPEQLVGKFMMMKYMSMSAQRHAELFWWYLHNRGIVPSERSAIIDFVGSKSNECFPGTYDPSVLAE
jgi:hypothetical protein